MKSNNKDVAEIEQSSYQMLSMKYIQEDLRKHNDMLLLVQMFLYDYQKIHGTTTECENIFGPMGVLQAKPYPPLSP